MQSMILGSMMLLKWFMLFKICKQHITESLFAKLSWEEMGLVLNR